MRNNNLERSQVDSEEESTLNWFRLVYGNFETFSDFAPPSQTSKWVISPKFYLKYRIAI